MPKEGQVNGDLLLYEFGLEYEAFMDTCRAMPAHTIFCFIVDNMPSRQELLLPLCYLDREVMELLLRIPSTVDGLPYLLIERSEKKLGLCRRW